MFSRGFNIFITVVMAILFAILYGVLQSTAVLWIGGLVLFFWINGCIREAISDNYYINAAYTTLTACVLTVPQIFYGGTPFGWLLYAVTAGYQMLAFFTNYDYTSDYTVNRDFGRNWRSVTKTLGEKIYGHYVIAQANWAAMILTGIGFLAGSFFLAALCDTYSLFFLLLIPVYTLLWNLIAFVYIKFIVGIDVPTGYSDHDEIDNLLKGFWYLIGAVLGAIVVIVCAPFHGIVMLADAIKDFFVKLRGDGASGISKWYWAFLIVITVYVGLAVFDLADFVERLFPGLTTMSIDLDIMKFAFPVTKWLFTIEIDVGLLLDILLLLPKLVVIILGVVLDLLIIIIVPLGWLLLNFLLFLLGIILTTAFELILPIGLAVGTTIFMVLYLKDTDRDFFDWLRTILLMLLPIALVVLYVLIAFGVITLF